MLLPIQSVSVRGFAHMEDVRGTRIQVRRHRIESKHVTAEDIATDKKDAEDEADNSTGAARVADSLAALDSKKVGVVPPSLPHTTGVDAGCPDRLTCYSCSHCDVCTATVALPCCSSRPLTR